MAVARPSAGHPYFRTLTLAAVVLLATSYGRSEARAIPYVVRVAHEMSAGTTCVLVDDTGAFHFESGDREQTKVYEGKISAAQLDALRQNLEKLSEVQQADVEEPLIAGPRDLLDIHIFRNKGTQELLFRSHESQQAYAAGLNPLLRWMDGLRKLPHRELSEDAGKRNCLPRGELALKARSQVVPPLPAPRTPLAGRQIAPPPNTAPPGLPLLQPLVQLALLEKTSSSTRQTCALVASDGQYRFERRFQKNENRKVENSLARGRFSEDELSALRKILESPALAGMRHREPPAGIPLNIKGVVLELSINRASGVQDLILTDSTRRSTFFYSGDGDVSKAAPLLGFVRKQIELRSAPEEKIKDLNRCSQLP